MKIRNVSSSETMHNFCLRPEFKYLKRMNTFFEHHSNTRKNSPRHKCDIFLMFKNLFFVIFFQFRLSFDQFPSSSAIFHFFSVADWISSKNDRGVGAGAAPKLEILSTKITSSFMSRDLHQQTLDLFLNLARQGEKAEYTIQ